ncbi:MAG: hypothetical protein NT129_02990 [Candidatus Aenigmarchaeota archaeon]|nr:hypothetical protein [Candidatus Aenigmarchaeota archaeon]
MKAAVIISIVIFIAMLLVQLSFAISSPGFSAFGRSVTMNFAFHIGSSKSNDTITYTDRYISSHDAGAVLALVSSSAFGTSFSELANDYKLEIRQPLENNRFLMAFTTGNNQNIASKANLSSIIQKTFGELTKSPTSFPVYLRLEYSDIDIINSIRWGPGSRELIIKNEGESNNRHKISIELIK